MGPDNFRMRQGNGEGRIAHQDGSLGLAGDRPRSAGHAFEHTLHVELDDMRPFTQALDQELGLAGGLGDQKAQVVRGADLAVGSRSAHRHGHAEGRRRLGLRGAQAGGQTGLRGQVSDSQSVALGSPVLHHQDHGEELMQQADVGGEHDHADHRRRGRIVLPARRLFEVTASLGHLDLFADFRFQVDLERRQPRSDEPRRGGS